MLPWLVITADQHGVGRGVRGYALVWFLRTYFDRRAVAKRTPDQARRGSVPQAETLFLGLPSTLAPDDIHRLVERTRPRRIVPFDYFDRHELPWSVEQEAALREVTDRYFKPWHEPAWRYNLRMGMLPLRTHRQLFLSIAWDRLARKLGRRPAPQYDVAFLGRPNLTAVMGDDGATRLIDQRVAWLRELREHARDLRLGGGLTEWDNDAFRQREAADPSLRGLCFRRHSVNFPAYWRTIRQARVLLSPGGNAPWTYRHYESLYAGAAVVTINFRERDMLVPLPRENMIHVPDGGSIVPAVREALAMAHDRPTLGEENFAHLERYLHYGVYAKSRQALLDRFLAQLDQ